MLMLILTLINWNVKVIKNNSFLKKMDNSY